MRRKPYLHNGLPFIPEIEDDIDSGDLLAVSDLSEVPDGYRRLVYHVNDHGNISLVKHFKNGNCREIWSFV